MTDQYNQPGVMLGNPDAFFLLQTGQAREEVPLAPYFKNLLVAIAAPGNSLALVDQYFRTAGLSRWLGSDMFARFSQSAVRLTVDYMAKPLSPLPVPDIDGAAQSVAVTVSQAVTQAQSDAWQAVLDNNARLAAALQG